VELTSERLLLRCGRAEDADALYLAARESVSTVGRWLPWCHSGYQREDALTRIALMQAWWAHEVSFSFLIFSRADHRLLGCSHVNELNRAQCRGNLGYWIRRTAEGRGYATEAARVTARWGFEQLGLMRLEIRAAAANLPSQRVAIKIGATPEGLWRNRIRIHRQQHDARGFSLIPADMTAWVK
jgi:RimJ/RimL family protein N-acetyltransferase